MQAMTTEKQRIAKRFFRSSTTYPDAAVMQKKMADQLMDELLSVRQSNRFTQVLEAGCGTGLLTDRLLQRCRIQKLVVNDITDQCGQTARAAQRKYPACLVLPCHGDMEQTPLPHKNDLIISSSVFQWAAAPHLLLRRLAKRLLPGGFLATATFGPLNLREVARLTGLSLPYWSMTDWQNALMPDFEILSAGESTHALWFTSGLEALRHMKQTGVNTLSPTTWPRTKTERFCRDYDAVFRTNGLVSLTYHPLFIIARKLCKGEGSNSNYEQAPCRLVRQEPEIGTERPAFPPQSPVPARSRGTSS